MTVTTNHTKGYIMQKTTLTQVNANRIRLGLDPFTVLPGTMRPGKTAKKNKAVQNANRAARAAANQQMKSKRNSRSK